jgi:hypothetical protein
MIRVQIFFVEFVYNHNEHVYGIHNISTMLTSHACLAVGFSTVAESNL